MEKEERNIDEMETLKAEKEKYKRKFEELKIMEEARSIVSSLPKNFNKERILAAIEDRLSEFIEGQDFTVNNFVNGRDANGRFIAAKDFISEIASMLK